jgi:hypothetical protein
MTVPGGTGAFLFLSFDSYTGVVDAGTTTTAAAELLHSEAIGDGGSERLRMRRLSRDGE